MSIVQSQIATPNFYYINGLQLSYVSTTEWLVSPGMCRDSTNKMNIVMSSSQTINFNLQGAGGMDVISDLTANTYYYCYAIGDSSGKNPSSVLASLEVNSPLLPSGYDAYYLIGGAATDSSANLMSFYGSINGFERTFHYATPFIILNAGTATTYTSASISTIPAIDNTVAILLSAFHNSTGSNIFITKKNGTPGTNGADNKGGGALASGQSNNVMLFQSVDNTGSLQYLVNGGNLTLSVVGYKMFLQQA